MKAALILLGLFSLHHYCRAGIIPATTTFVRHATSITHPSTVAYNQPALAYTYSAPVTYSVYSPPVVQYSQSLFTPQNIFAPQTIFGQYPGLLAQTPTFIGTQQTGGGPTIEAADKPQGAVPQQPSTPPPSSSSPPQQSPILGSGTPGTTMDDDTVSIEASQ
ncbi:uncharacterized protein [Euwallacea fornicatus]|uniref:uncharacterized protein isoform X2 n=1 Tax=Euwallacea fornicatus TaxID=995702 RepID=UPI00338D7922